MWAWLATHAMCIWMLEGVVRDIQIYTYILHGQDTKYYSEYMCWYVV